MAMKRVWRTHFYTYYIFIVVLCSFEWFTTTTTHSFRSTITKQLNLYCTKYMLQNVLSLVKILSIIVLHMYMMQHVDFAGRWRVNSGKLTFVYKSYICVLICVRARARSHFKHYYKCLHFIRCEDKQDVCAV